jgi:hypothetical protein
MPIVVTGSAPWLIFHPRLLQDKALQVSTYSSGGNETGIWSTLKIITRWKSKR